MWTCRFLTPILLGFTALIADLLDPTSDVAARHVLSSALNEKLNNLSVSNDSDNVTEDQFMEMLQQLGRGLLVVPWDPMGRTFPGR